MTILETERLLLRRFVPTDVEVLAPILADLEVMRFSLTGPEDHTGAAARIERFVAGYRRHGFGRWAMIERQSNTLVGYAGIGMMEFDNAEQPELGYRLARAHWGRGLATEAAIACRDHGNSKYRLNRLVALIEPENTGSIRVAERAGFAYDRDSRLGHLAVRVYEWSAA